MSEDDHSPRSLAWSPADGEEHYSTFFQSDGAERVVRKVVDDLDQEVLDADSYAERVHAMAAFVEERLCDFEGFLGQVREFARRERRQDVLASYDRDAGQLVQATRDGFGYAFGRMLDYLHDGDPQAVEDAVVSAVEAMERLVELDRLSEEAHQSLCKLGYDKDGEAVVEGAGGASDGTWHGDDGAWHGEDGVVGGGSESSPADHSFLADPEGDTSLEGAREEHHDGSADPAVDFLPLA